ncbi:MAG: ABC transporter transmembrane domain-containing protein [Deinococcales bacterium]
MIKFVGTFVILLQINVELTLIVFCFLPLMGLYAFYFNGRMKRAMMKSKARIADINAQVEDSLSGIRVVKSFAREAFEQQKFARLNERFLQSRREEYGSEAWLYNGVVAFTQLFSIAIVVFGAQRILGGMLDLADLVTYLLYVGILIEPIRTALNFVRLYQEGMTGFERFWEMPEHPPTPATSLSSIQGQLNFKT